MATTGLCPVELTLGCVGGGEAYAVAVSLGLGTGGNSGNDGAGRAGAGTVECGVASIQLAGLAGGCATISGEVVMLIC